MKPTHLLLIALFALTVGCKSYTTSETLSSSGNEDAAKPEVAQKDDGATGVDVKTDPAETTNDPLSISGASKPLDAAKNPDLTTKPVEETAAGDAAGNSAINAKSLAGKYDGKMLEESIALFLSMAPPERRAEAETELRGATIQLDLTADGKYSLLTKSKKASETNRGTWTYDEKTGIATMGAPEINPEQIAKMKAQGATDAQIAASRSQTMECKVSKDGRTLTFMQEQGGMKLGLTFTKK